MLAGVRAIPTDVAPQRQHIDDQVLAARAELHEAAEALRGRGGGGTRGSMGWAWGLNGCRLHVDTCVGSSSSSAAEARNELHHVSHMFSNYVLCNTKRTVAAGRTWKER